MGGSNPSEAEFVGLLETAESKYAAWHLKELQPERERRLNELKKEKLNSGGRAIYALRINRELSERAARQRIAFYSAIARESGTLEMLARSRLDQFRQLIMTSVGHEVAALKEGITRDNLAAGDRIGRVRQGHHHRCMAEPARNSRRPTAWCGTRPRPSARHSWSREHSYPLRSSSVPRTGRYPLGPAGSPPLTTRSSPSTIP